MPDRRTFLLGTAGVAGALVIGWGVMPVRQRLTPSKPTPVAPGQTALNGWVKIAADNTVTVMASKAEMGQGIHTGVAMLLAEELHADWSQIRVEFAPVDKIYNNLAGVAGNLPFRPDDDSEFRELVTHLVRKVSREFGAMLTGGSTSISDVWMPMRQAGACARIMLCAAAAEQWKVDARTCRAEHGKVLGAEGRSATFGELAALAARQSMPDDPPLMDPAQFRLIGTSAPRLDMAGKLDGRETFGIDVLPDGLLYASVQMCPTVGGTLAKIADDSKARAIPGVVDVVKLEPYHGGSGGVAVIADNAYTAMIAVDAVVCEWDAGPAKGLGTEEIFRRLNRALDEGDGHAWYRHGNIDDAWKGARPPIEAAYSAPYLAHAALEPVNCTAQVGKDRAIVWAATQMPTLARKCAAKVADLDVDKVDLRQHPIGGAFGRRLEVDFICQAVAIARAEKQGRPVQTIWSRPQDTTHDFYRPACVSRFKAALSDGGDVVAWQNTSASQSILASSAKRNFGLPDISGLNLDKSTVEGAFDLPYDFQHVRVGQKTVDLPVPVGYWRSVGHSHQAFFTECFLDELAVAAGQDAIAFRMRLLQKQPRERYVLERVAALSNWRKPLAGGRKRARGVALHRSFGSVVAQVAEVSQTMDGKFHVDTVYCVIDCGLQVNPNLIRQQVEGGIVFGLSAALWQQITLNDGAVQQTYYSGFRVVRMPDCPDIAVEIIDTPDSRALGPQGVGEAATPPIAPAVANAVSRLTGKRVRTLPLMGDAETPVPQNGGTPCRP